MIGNVCMFGQIASMIEALGLTYDEIVYHIPYRQLLLMQKDKLRPCFGIKVQKESGKDMASRRRKNKKEQ